jgi:hypothetical protein
MSNDGPRQYGRTRALAQPPSHHFPLLQRVVKKYVPSVRPFERGQLACAHAGVNPRRVQDEDLLPFVAHGDATRLVVGVNEHT